MIKDFVKKHILLSFAVALTDRTPIRVAPLPHHSRNRCAPTFGRKNDVYLLHAPTSAPGSPRKMPHCAMDLIPVNDEKQSATTTDSNAVVMSDEVVALANIETEVVGSGATNKEVRLFGNDIARPALRTNAVILRGRTHRETIDQCVGRPC